MTARKRRSPARAANRASEMRSAAKQIGSPHKPQARAAKASPEGFPQTLAVTDGRQLVGTVDTRFERHAGPVIAAQLSGTDVASALGITARGHAPVLALCRKLLAAGFDPARPVLVHRGETLCVIVRTIREGAKLTVEDRPGGGKPPRFIRHRPMPDRAEGSPPVRQNRSALTGGERGRALPDEGDR
jgi:hypothetical protein